MAVGMDFGERKESPYMKRRDRTFGRTGGRPTGTAGGAQTTGITKGDPGFDRLQAQYGRGVGTAGAITGQVGAGGIGGTTPTGSGVQQGLGQSPYAGFLKSLTQPIEYQDRSQQRFNIARGQIQAGTKTQMGQMEKYMGGRGFRGGESGIADTAMGQVARGGAERLATATQQIGESEAERAQGYAGLNLQRQLGGAGIALTGEEGALNRMMQYYGGQQQAEQAQWQPWWQGMAGGGGY